MSSAPLVSVQQHKLAKHDTIRESINKIGNQVTELQEKNRSLHEEINALESELSTLGEAEAALAYLTEKQGSSVDCLLKLVAESKEISAAQKVTLRNEALQTLINLVFEVLNDNFQIDERGIEHLIIGLRNMECLEEFHEDKFRAQIARGRGSTRDILAAVGNLTDPEVEDAQISSTANNRSYAAQKSQPHCVFS